VAERFDKINLLPGASWEITPQGGLRVPANVSKVGCLAYPGRVEYISEEDLFDSDSMKTLDSCPCVIDHTGGFVSIADYSDRSVGVSDANSAQRDGDYLACTLTINDADAVAGIMAGELVEISAGYDCKIVEEKGVDPVSGLEYDAKQTKRKYNHIALLMKGQGRAGQDVAIRLDSKTEGKTEGLPMDQEAEKKDGCATKTDGCDPEKNMDATTEEENAESGQSDPPADPVKKTDAEGETEPETKTEPSAPFQVQIEIGGTAYGVPEPVATALSKLKEFSEVFSQAKALISSIGKTENGDVKIGEVTYGLPDQVSNLLWNLNYSLQDLASVSAVRTDSKTIRMDSAEFQSIVAEKATERLGIISNASMVGVQISDTKDGKKIEKSNEVLMREIVAKRAPAFAERLDSISALELKGAYLVTAERISSAAISRALVFEAASGQYREDSKQEEYDPQADHARRMKGIK
jgi:hypothetical protein